MSHNFHKVLKQLVPDETPERLDQTARELEALVARLTAVIESVGDASTQQDILAHFSARALAELKKGNGGPRPMKLTPELLAWVQRDFNLEQFLAEIKEAEATGGVQIDDIIHQLEQEFGKDIAPHE